MQIAIINGQVASTSRYCRNNCPHWFGTAIYDLQVRKDFKRHAFRGGHCCTRTNIRTEWLQDVKVYLHTIVQKSGQENRDCQSCQLAIGRLQKIDVGDLVLAAREDVFAGEPLSRCWRGPRWCVTTIYDYCYEIEDMHNESIPNANAPRLKFYLEAALNTDTFMFHVFTSETGIAVHRLVQSVDDAKVSKVMYTSMDYRSPKTRWSRPETSSNIFRICSSSYS